MRAKHSDDIGWSVDPQLVQGHAVWQYRGVVGGGGWLRAHRMRDSGAMSGLRYAPIIGLWLREGGRKDSCRSREDIQVASRL